MSIVLTLSTSNGTVYFSLGISVTKANITAMSVNTKILLNRILFILTISQHIDNVQHYKENKYIHYLRL